MSDDDRLIDELRAALDEGAEQLPTTPPPFGQVTATGHRPDAIGRWRLLTIAAAAIILAAGGAVIAINAGSDSGTPPAVTQPPDDVAVTPGNSSVGPSGTEALEATVIEFPDGKPQLCTAVTTSPPGCEGAPIANWSWSDVEHHEGAGTRWGRYSLVGSSDETTAEFTLSQPAESAPDESMSVSTMALREEVHSTPCPEPETGWRPPPTTIWGAGREPVYPQPTDDDGYYPPEGVIDTPGFGGLWWDRSSGVLNVRIVGSEQDRKAAADSLDDLTGAPVCIVPSQYTAAELEEIYTELINEYGAPMANDGGPIADLSMTSGGAGDPSGYVPVMLRAPDRDLIAELSERYGSAIKIVPRFGDSWIDIARRSSVPPDTGP